MEELLSEQHAYFPVTVQMPKVPQVRLYRLEADVFVRSSKELVAAVHDVSTGEIICWKEKIQVGSLHHTHARTVSPQV